MKTPTVMLVGIITKVLPESRYNVMCSDIDTTVLCYIAGKLRRGHGKPDVNDKVEFVVDESNVKLGRITKFLR